MEKSSLNLVTKQETKQSGLQLLRGLCIKKEKQIYDTGAVLVHVEMSEKTEPSALMIFWFDWLAHKAAHWNPCAINEHTVSWRHLGHLWS